MPPINEKLQGLLGNPTFNLGLGLLAASGPRRGPRISFGQGLAEAVQYANQQQSQYNQLQAQRQQLGRNQVFKQIGALMTPQMSPGPVVGPVGPAPISTPQGQQQLVSLLGQVAPQQVANALMQRVFAQQQQPTLSRSVNDFMFFQQHPELREAFKDFQASNQDPEARLRLQELQLSVESQLQDIADRNEDRTQQTAITQIAAIKDLEDLKKAGESNLNLVGTFLELGLPGRGVARTALGGVKAAQDAFGLDSSASSRVITDFDNFQKVASNITLNSLPRFTALGAINSSELEQVIQANAQIGASPETNALIIADAIKTIIRSSEATGVNISNPQEWIDYANELVERARQQTRVEESPEHQSAQGGNIIDFEELP